LQLHPHIALAARPTTCYEQSFHLEASSAARASVARTILGEEGELLEMTYYGTVAPPSFRGALIGGIST